MPYFTIDRQGCGLAMAIGWPGQWAAGFERGQWDWGRPISLSIKAGQEETHFTLYPGERLRSPRIVFLFYSGDYYDGQNEWRKYMRAYKCPKPSGRT